MRKSFFLLARPVCVLLLLVSRVSLGADYVWESVVKLGTLAEMSPLSEALQSHQRDSW